MPLWQVVCDPYFNFAIKYGIIFKLSDEIKTEDAAKLAKCSTNRIERYKDWIEPAQITALIKSDPKLLQYVLAKPDLHVLLKKAPSGQYIRSMFKKGKY